MISITAYVPGLYVSSLCLLGVTYTYVQYLSGKVYTYVTDSWKTQYVIVCRNVYVYYIDMLCTFKELLLRKFNVVYRMIYP